MERCSTIQGLPLDLLISQEFSNEVSCPICLQILYNPVSCELCQYPFCKSCIDSWISKSKTCPNRCKYYKEVKINQFARNLLNKIKLRCPLDGCKQELQYEDYTRHAADQCDYITYACIGCGMQGRKNIIKLHTNMCEQIPENCFYCRKSFKRKFLEQHIKTCPEKTICCEHCNNKVRAIDFDRHLKECGYVKISCGFCGTNYLRSREHEHSSEVCRGMLRDIVRREFSEKQILQSRLKLMENELEYVKKVNESLRDELSRYKDSDINIENL
jgi:hypothetical protein